MRRDSQLVRHFDPALPGRKQGMNDGSPGKNIYYFLYSFSDGKFLEVSCHELLSW